MNKSFQVVAVFAGSLLLWGCSSSSNQKNDKIETQELYANENPEAVKGNIDVYTSMARTVKYNVDAVAHEVNEKIFTDYEKSSPKDVIRKIATVKTGNSNPLYDSLKVLDFSVMYAVANLSDYRAYIDANLYVKSAQNLSLAAIKAHKNVLFTSKKIKEIDRIMTREARVLKGLNDKMERVGTLNKSDMAYKKSLDVALLKLKELKDGLSFAEVEYRGLVKVDTPNMVLEGRKFYELEDFDEKFDIHTFQSSAFRNRNEFVLSKELNRTYTFTEIESNIVKKYPEVETMNLNGYDFKNPAYVEELEKRAYKVAESLIDAVMLYKNAKKAEVKQNLKEKAFDELGIAVFTQVEAAFNLVKFLNADLAGVKTKILKVKKEIREFEKTYRLDNTQKIELLNKRMELLVLESQQSQIVGERAMAIRSLYYYAGFSPFNKILLKANISDIVSTLKVGFTQDVVEMLAATPNVEQNEKASANEWAKKENWLEELMNDKSGKIKSGRNLSYQTGDFDLYDDSYNKMKIIQLGSYRHAENANIEWAMLKELYPELANYKPVVEKSEVNGASMFRLIIDSNTGGWVELCNKLRSDKAECLLR